MKLPKKISILGRKWTIHVVDQPIDEKGEEAEGLCDPKSNRIEIEKGLTDAKTVEIFIHEYGHAVAFELGIDDEDVPTWIEHMMVIQIAKDMAHNNAKIFAKLFGALTLSPECRNMEQPGDRHGAEKVKSECEGQD